MPQLIASNIIAHRFELTSLAATNGPALDRKERTCPERSQLDLASPTHVRIHLYGLRFTECRLPPHKPQPRPKAHGDLSKSVLAPTRRRQEIRELRDLVSIQVHLRLTLFVQPHRRRSEERRVGKEARSR